jgi:hypothetical protein
MGRLCEMGPLGPHMCRLKINKLIFDKRGVKRFIEINWFRIESNDEVMIK